MQTPLDSWKTLLTSVPMPTLILSLEQGEWRAVACNVAAAGLFQVSGPWTPKSLESLMSGEEALSLGFRLGQDVESLVLYPKFKASGHDFTGRLRLRRLPEKGAWLALLEDVSTEREAMEALRENERSYRRIVDFSPDAIVVLGEGLVVFANQSCEHLLGLDSPDEIWGTEFIESVHPDDRALWLQRESQLKGSELALPPVEMRLRRKDGVDLEVEITQYQTYSRGKGGMQVIVRDIGPRKRMERQLKESEERYKGLADAAFDGVAVHVDGKIRELNRAFEGIFGRDHGSLLGESIESRF